MSKKQTPDKWAKYELLDEFGLLAPDYLKHAIHRYSWEDRFNLILDLINDFREPKESRFYVVKLVPSQLCYLLPNIRVSNPADVDELRNTFLNLDPKYEEVWFCKTIIDSKSFSVAGRIVIDKRMGDSAHTIEQVWRCSPRLLQEFGKDFPFPYMMATRPGWGWRFRVQNIYIPESSTISGNSLIEDLGLSMRSIYQHRERLVLLEEFLFDCGCDAISIEYKIEGANLQFIDWDTHQDRHVLRCWNDRKLNV